MNELIQKASRYKLKGMILESVSGKKTDIKFLTNSFILNENMSDGFLSGTVAIFDGTGILYNFPLRGEEYLTLDIEDFDGNEFRHKFHVFGVDDLRPVSENNDSLLRYTLHFASVHKIFNESAHIRRAYRNGQLHNYAEEIYNGTISDGKPFISDPSDNSINLVVPGYNPIQAMHMMARKAYSNTHQSGTFRFFETKENFQFRNMEAIGQEYASGDRKAFRFTYRMTPDSSPEGQLSMRSNIVEFDLGTHANTIRDLSTGNYHKEILEIDTDNRQIVNTTYRHHDEFDSFYHPDGLHDYHTDEINTLAYSPKVMLVNKNWSTPQDPSTSFRMGFTQTTDVLTKKITSFDQFNLHRIMIKIHGNLKVNAGDMVDVFLPTFKAISGERDADNPYNGLWLVDSITHKFNDDDYYADLTLGRMGLKP